MTASPATLAQHLEPAEISFATLDSRYRPMLELVRLLIGVVPNCDRLLEIWPPGFRTYNLLVPNALNLPFSLWGMGAPKAQVGLAVYTASRAAGCAYCSAHTCSFALRRGADPETLVGDRGPRDAAVAAVAAALARVPCDLTKDQASELARHFSPADVEWIVLAVGMMGFLNKFMDAVGVELEADSIAEVGALLRPTGWSPGKHGRAAAEAASGSTTSPRDNLLTYLRAIRRVPAAILLERGWIKGVPDRWPEAGNLLEARTGYSFPILGKLRHKRAIRALATILRDNLDPATSAIGLRTKSLAGLVYATVVGNATLAEEARLLAARSSAGQDGSTIEAVKRFAQDVTASPPPGLATQEAAGLVLARAAAPSPAEVGPAILAEVAPLLAPAAIIELMVWLSVQQMLHRLSSYYAVAESRGVADL